jgi:predicted ATPase
LELASVSTTDLVAAAIAAGLGLNTSAGQMITDLESYLRPRRLLPAQALASRLDQRFSLLTGGARDPPERQRTLKNTLDWSFDLLSPGEQALFAQVGVFAGSFNIPAAEAVCAPNEGRASEPGPVMETLGSLVDSSLVRAETRGGEPRFSLLETVQDYARERLAGGGDWVQAHDRHAAYFRALAEPSGADLAGPGQLPWVSRLESEHDNLLAAMSWLVDQGHIDQATHLFLMTWRFWWLRGHLAEFARLGDELVAGQRDLLPYQRAVALTGPGFILIANGDLARAQTAFEQSLPLYRQTSEKLGVVLNATVLAVLGHLAAIRRDYADASKLLDEG